MNTQDETNAAAFKSSPPIALDPARYLPDMAEIDLSDAQKTELLAALWDIMVRMVDLSFDLRSADFGGQIFGDFTAAAAGSENPAMMDHPITIGEAAPRKDNRQ